MKSGATVGGAVTEFANVLPLPSITLVDLNISAGGSSVTVDKNATMNVEPGSYGRLVVKTGGTLTLTAGAYAFEKLDVDKDATLEFNLENGAVIIDVTGNVEFDKHVVMIVTGGDASDILFRVNGDSVKLGKEGIILGTYVAPHADIEVEEDTQVTGALYGNEIQLKKHVSVTGAPAIELLVDRFLP